MHICVFKYIDNNLALIIDIYRMDVWIWLIGAKTVKTITFTEMSDSTLFGKFWLLNFNKNMSTKDTKTIS